MSELRLSNLQLRLYPYIPVVLGGYIDSRYLDIRVSHINVNDDLAKAQEQLRATTKALGDLQRNYAAAVQDFVTINGSLQLRSGELLRERDRLREDRDRLHRELEKLRPPEPLFKLNEVVLITHVHNGTTLITSRRFTADGRWEYQNGYSQIWYAEASLRKLSEENKG